jgi:nucleotide-binding universal stress UspA family protein
VLCSGYLDPHRSSSTGFDPEYGVADARDALDTIVGAALAEGAAATVERSVVNDLAARGLLESAVDADLLVLGARGVGTLSELSLGSVSYQCAQHSTVPVAVIRSQESPTAEPFGKVVVGIDGSDDSRAALEWAVEAARVRAAVVIAVTAFRPPSAVSRFLVAGPTDVEDYEAAARQMLDRVVDEVSSRGLGAPVTREVAIGDPRAVLVQRTADADLVVVGSRGRGGFTGLLLGSVSRHVAHHAPCPAVIMPHQR